MIQRQNTVHNKTPDVCLLFVFYFLEPSNKTDMRRTLVNRIRGNIIISRFISKGEVN